MNYRPNLIFQPCYYSYADILQAFQVGKPLKPEQLNFLLWHARQLSSAHLDPVMRYYKIGEQHHHFPGCIHSFVIADDLINRESHPLFKEKLEALLKRQHHGVMVRFTGEQLDKFLNNEQIDHVIYYENNKLVVDSPLFHGKTVHAYFFQVGDIVGIIKYEQEKEASTSHPDALVYFEELHKRQLTEYIHEFYKKYNQDIELLKKQQFELQALLNKIQLEKNILQKDIIQKDINQRIAMENQYFANKNKLMSSHPYQLLLNEQVLREQLLIQESLENEKQLQNESSEAELGEIEAYDAKILAEKEAKNEQLQKQQLEAYITEQKLLERKRVENEIRKTQIPDLHQFKPASVFPPRYELKLGAASKKKGE